jgi:hypothetical protein
MNIKALWNSLADHQNQWDSLGEDEKLEFAMAHEREECAKVCEEESNRWAVPVTSDDYGLMWAECATAIRARGEA